MKNLLYKRTTAVIFSLLLGFIATSSSGYPLDGGAESGIRRLDGYRGAPNTPAGAVLTSSDITLHLRHVADIEFDDAPPNPALQSALQQLLAARDPSYAIVLVDFSDAGQIKWAGVNPDLRQNIGSVGKILCMLALFEALAEAFPATVDRARILRTSMVRAGDWITGDHHAVPRYQPTTGTNQFSVLRIDDEFLLSEWVDHAVSVSANGAGNVIWREAMLIKQFGNSYPLSWDETEAFFRDTPKTVLAALARDVMVTPLKRSGLNPEQIVQGSFWTPSGKRHVPGSQSFGTPRELARFMLRMEQGRLVDPWSSLEMKKYLYVTKRRYRYIYAPELRKSAVYFKSGSLYQCRPEEGFRCGKYMGNVRNLMNSVTTVETLPTDPPTRRYIAALLSNVLRVNSAWDHSRIGAAVHAMVQTGEAGVLPESASERELEAIGRSD